MPSRCVVCGNTHADGVSLFTFPANPALNLQWRVNMKRLSAREPGGALWMNSRGSRICSHHFEDDCLLISRTFAKTIGCHQPRRLQLKPDAVPTIFTTSPRPRGAIEKKMRAETIRQIFYTEIQEPPQVILPAPILSDHSYFSSPITSDDVPLESPDTTTHQVDLETCEVTVAADPYVLTDITNNPASTKTIREIFCAEIQEPTLSDHSYFSSPITSDDVPLESPDTTTHQVDLETCEVTVAADPYASTDITNNPASTKTYSKRVGTPKRWWPKPAPPKPPSRSFATQTDDVIIVDEECHCRRPSPSVTTPDADDDTSVTSETSEMDWDGDADDPDFDPDMEKADSDISDDDVVPLVDGVEPKDDQKYIVFESALKELLQVWWVVFGSM